MTMSKEERKMYFLQDTRDILADYDGMRTVESLKGLIDETQARLNAYLNDEIEEYENSL